MAGEGHRYLVALGSNMRHHRHGSPRAVLGAALEAMADAGLAIEAAGPVIASAPLGPSRRRYANSAVLLRTPLEPPALLALLKGIEAGFGRRPGGGRWRSRVLDLDIVLWDGGAWASPGLVIPHTGLRSREFVLRPGASLAPRWRDPIAGLTLRQLLARLTRLRPIPR